MAMYVQYVLLASVVPYSVAFLVANILPEILPTLLQERISHMQRHSTPTTTTSFPVFQLLMLAGNLIADPILDQQLVNPNLTVAPG